MVRVECVATRGFVRLTSVPLLTELISIKDGFSYKHGAPDGVVITRQYRIPLETAKSQLLSRKPRKEQGKQSSISRAPIERQ